MVTCPSSSAMIGQQPLGAGVLGLQRVLGPARQVEAVEGAQRDHQVGDDRAGDEIDPREGLPPLRRKGRGPEGELGQEEQAQRRRRAEGGGDRPLPPEQEQARHRPGQEQEMRARLAPVRVAEGGDGAEPDDAEIPAGGGVAQPVPEGREGEADDLRDDPQHQRPVAGRVVQRVDGEKGQREQDREAGDGVDHRQAARDAGRPALQAEARPSTREQADRVGHRRPASGCGVSAAACGGAPRTASAPGAARAARRPRRPPPCLLRTVRNPSIRARAKSVGPPRDPSNSRKSRDGEDEIRAHEAAC
jgi:hypothetical protein